MAENSLHRNSLDANNKLLLISIHDVSPFYERQVDVFLKELKKRKIKKFSLVIIPELYECGYNSNTYAHYDISQNKRLISKILSLKKYGAELILHGYDHHNDGKNLNDPKKIDVQLKKGIAFMKKNFHIMPKGYLPPRWDSSRHLEKSLSKYFVYTEDFHKIILFGKNTPDNVVSEHWPIGMETLCSNRYFEYDTITPLMTRYYSFIYARFIINKPGIVRYALHPRELDNGNFQATLKLLDNFLAAGWKPVIYSELGRMN